MSLRTVLFLAIFVLGYSNGIEICSLESCNDLRLVKHCNNVQRCISEVWLKEQPTRARDNVCDICLKMVKEARDQLNSNETKEEIKEVFEGTCKFLRIKAAVDMCMKFADEYVDELVQMLSSQMDPEMVCTVAKLCNNDMFRKIQEKSEECVSCRKFTAATSEMMATISKENFKNEMLRMCPSWGSYSDACFFNVLLLSDKYYNQTLYALERHPCEVIGFCPSKPQVSVGAVAVRDSLGYSWKEAEFKLCSLCPSVLTNLKNRILKSDSTEDFRLEIYRICKDLAMFQDSCSRLLNDYYYSLYVYFKKDFQPEYFCSNSIGFCSKNSGLTPDRPLLPLDEGLFSDMDPFQAILPVQPMPDVVQEEEHRGPVKVALSRADVHVGHISKNQNCKTCIDMFDSLNLLTVNEENYLKNVFDVVCNFMPDYQTCENFLFKFFGKFEEIFVPKFSSARICPELVPNCSVDVTRRFLKPDGPSTTGACFFCQRMFQSFNRTLNGNDMNNALSKAFVGLCDSLPEREKKVCENFWQIFSEKATTLMTSKFNENQTCSLLKLCAKSGPQENQGVQGVEKDSCKVCLRTVEAIYAVMKDGEVTDDLKKLILNSCESLISPLRHECRNFVEKHIDDLIRYITNHLEPQELCEKIHFCKKNTSDTAVSPPAVLSSSSPSPSNPSSYAIKDLAQKDIRHGEIGNFNKKISCDFCLRFVQLLLDELQSNKTEDAIRKALSQVCKHFPSEVISTCENLIEEYSEDIIDMIIADFNANEICVRLRFCNATLRKSSPEVSFSVGTNEIVDKYNPEGMCRYCKFLQYSLVDNGNRERAAEGMLALLIEVCLKNFNGHYKECREKVFQEVLPYGKDVLFKMSNICFEFNICPTYQNPEKAALRRMHLAVEECALCETLVQIIQNHQKMLVKDFDFAKSSTIVCVSVPKDKKSLCEALLTSYGPSIVDLLVEQKVKPDLVCNRLNLCDEGQQAKLNMPVTQPEPSSAETKPVSGECMQGPDFWCANSENAKKCGTFEHCREVVWTNGVPPV